MCVCARDPVHRATGHRRALRRRTQPKIGSNDAETGQRSLKASKPTIRESLLSYSPKKAVFSTEYSFYVFVLFERSLANFTVIASHVGLMETSWPEASLFGIQFPEPIPVAPQ